MKETSSNGVVQMQLSTGSSSSHPLNPCERTMHVLEQHGDWMVGKDIMSAVNADGGEELSHDIMQNVLDGIAWSRRAVICYMSARDRNQLNRSYRISR